MGSLSIKVAIANRVYPLKIEEEEEEQVRKAAKMVNDSIREYEENYAVSDKQDLLAMCALNVSTQFLNRSMQPSEKEEIENRVAAIDALLSAPLQGE